MKPNGGPVIPSPEEEDSAHKRKKRIKEPMPLAIRHDFASIGNVDTGNKRKS